MKTTLDFLKMKKEKEKIVMLTAYDYPSGKLAERAGVDLILVGDSLGMVVLGYESTIHVTMEDMVHHTKAVKRGAKNTFVVTDMPFCSYHGTLSETVKNAARLLQEGGAQAVKVEGADDVLTVIQKLTKSGIPVMAHLGLTPQSVGVLGGYRVQGRNVEDAKKLIEDAKKCEEMGAFALVLECVPKELARQIALDLTIPVIGIGAGSGVDGQVLVYHDLVGYGVDRVAKFVKQYEHIDDPILRAIETYRQEVKDGDFPGQEHSYSLKEETLLALYGGVRK